MNEITTAILKNNVFCTVATVDDDGSPRATPVHFAFDETNIYWLSKDNTVHSGNIARDRRVFIVVFDSRQAAETLGDRGAVYIATHALKLSGDAAIAARDVYADRFPDDNGRKLVDWNVYAAPIGVMDAEKSVDQLVYYRDTGEVAS